jgi:uracil-DNA glycosylase family 4
MITRCRWVLPLPDTKGKVGCAHCPLYPFTATFDPARYKPKNADKIRGADNLHQVETHCVEDPWEPVDVLCVGEAPGKDEDHSGRPFVGASGQLLRNTVTTLATEVSTPLRIGFTNVVRCRPPRNRRPSKREVTCCAPRLIREIQARRPRLLIACGNAAMEPLVGCGGVTYYCGVRMECVLPVDPKPAVLVNLHPAYVLRNSHEMERFAETLLYGLRWAAGDVTEPPGHGEYHVVTDLTEAKALLARLATCERVSFDTETGSLTPFQSRFPRLLCFSFSEKPFIGWTIPYDHAESPWRDGPDRTILREALRQFFIHPVRKIAQNEKFDRQHILAALGVEPVNVVDSMLMHLAIDERQGTHGLKEMAYKMTGLGGYDKPIEVYKAEHAEADPDRGGSYANIPGNLLFYYAAMDTDVCYRCTEWMEAHEVIADDPVQQTRVQTFLPQLSRVLAMMEYNGARVDPHRAKAVDAFLRMKAEEVETKLHTYPEVQQATENLRSKKRSAREREEFHFNAGSPDQLRHLLFDVCGLTPTNLTEKGLERLAERWLVEHEANPALTFEDVLSSARDEKEWRHFSTNAETLQDFARDGCDLAKDVLQHRGHLTLANGFSHPLCTLPIDGIIHGSFLAHGTKTGRLASRAPNLMACPNKGGGMLKSAYVSRFVGGLILALDYSQIELRIAAAYFREPAMIEAYKNGEDLHKLTAQAIASIPAAAYDLLPDAQKKELRTRAKRVNFLTLYQGGPPALVRTLRQDGIFVSEERAEEMLENFYRSRPQLVKNIERLKQMVQTQGFLRTFTANIRRVPEVMADDRALVARALRQIVNFPIQCIAAQMMLFALVLVSRELELRGLRSLLIITVHDSMVLDCPAEEALEVALLAKHIMENLRFLSAEKYAPEHW